MHMYSHEFYGGNGIVGAQVKLYPRIPRRAITRNRHITLTIRPHYKQGRQNEKRARRGADFVEEHRQNFNYVKIHTLEFRGSVAFLFRQILTDHILTVASAITLGINTSQISSIDSATAGFISQTEGILKTYCYIIFFILKGHFCPSCPPPSSGVPDYKD